MILPLEYLHKWCGNMARTRRIKGTSILIVPVSKLLLDNANPRIPLSKGQKEALGYMIRGLWDKLRPLAESIAVNGYDHFEPLLVVEADDGNYVVREGNRRLTVLKMLLNPNVIPKDYPRARKGITEIRKKAKDLDALRMVPCSLTSMDATVRIMDRRHGGERGGVGVVSWGPIEAGRFKRSNGESIPQLDVLDDVVAYGKLSKDAKEIYYTDKFSLTNLERLIKDQKDSRKRLGIELDGGKVVYMGDRDNIMTALTDIVEEIATEKIKVNDIYTAEDGKNYLNKKLGVDASLYDTSMSTPSGSGTTSREDSEDGEDDLGADLEDSERASTAMKPRKKRRTGLIKPTTVIEDFRGENKAEALFDELKRLDLDGHKDRGGYKYSVSMALRSFVELSADAYADRHGIPLRSPDPRYKGKEMDRPLVDIINEVCKDLMARRAADPTMDISTDALKCAMRLHDHSNKENFILTTELNLFVHDRGHHPNVEGLRTLWDEMEGSLVAIWKYM